MSELLDIYDENGNHLGTENRNIVHQNGLWHKTIHCWIIKDKKNILFQKRSSTLLDNPDKLYTTVSGHIQAGESLEDAFNREVTEELGIEIRNPHKLYELPYSADFMKKDNSEFHDRAFSNVFIALCDTPLTDYHLQEEELDGIVEVDIHEVLSLFKDELESISGTGYIKENDSYKLNDLTLTKDNFLSLSHETHLTKYGRVLEESLKYLESL